MRRIVLAMAAIALIAAVPSPAGAFDCTGDSLVTLQVGIADNFAPPTEPVYPDSNHLLFITTVYNVPLRYLDELETDKAMGHTFQWEPFEIVQAELEIKLRCLNTNSANDRLAIEFNDGYFNGENENWKWTAEISAITGMPWTGYGEEATVVIDLVNPPPDYYGRTSILPHLADGNLDVNVQDDTAVDYIVLRLCGGGDTAPPGLVSVTTPNAGQIDILFSEPLDPVTAEDVSNYAVFESADPGSTVPVADATLLPDVRTVRLDLGSPLTVNVQYTLQVSGVEDVAGNPIVSAEIEFIMEDTEAPVLVSAAAQSNLLVDAAFSEALDPLTAEDAGNYEVYELGDPAGTIAISDAALDGAGTIVALTLADPLQYNVMYVLRVNNVEDLAGNPVAPNSEVTIQSPAGPFECTGDSLVTLQAGIADNFAQPTEPVYPDANHLLFITTVYGVPLRYLDESGTDKAMGHTFQWEPFEIVKAQLEIKLRCLNSLSANDRLNIEFNDNYFNGEGENWKWTDEISAITGMPWSEYGEEATIVIDLVNPPPDYYGRTSIMPYLADGNLDVNVQDDTAVDYIVLRLCGGAPAPPELVSVTALSMEQLDVLFNEPLDPVTAEDVSNYALFESADPGSTAPVVNATLLADAVTVRLDFGSPLTPAVQYTLQVSDVEDLAGNPIVSGEIEFIMEDAVAPVLLSAAVQSNLLVNAVFSEALDPVTAEDEGNYELYELADSASTIAISDAVLDGSGTVVALTLAGPLPNDVTYVLRVNNVEDLAGNPVAPNSKVTIYESDPPGMVSVTLEDMRTFLVAFDEPVSEAGAEDAESYALHETAQPSNVVDVKAAELLIDGVTVRLTLWTALIHGTSYTLHANGVTDLVGNPVPPESTLEFVATDSYPPELVAVTPENALTVRVYFNEGVDAATAQTISNYEIFETGDPSNTVAVTGAVRLSGGSSVRLSLEVYLAPDVDYTLRASNVEDLAGNPIEEGAEREFRYTGSSVAGYIGLYIDAAHSENEVWAEGEFIPYNYYVWCLPSENGQICAEFAVSYSANVTPSAVMPNDDIISVSLGDLPGGMSVCFYNCQTDWVWTHQQQFYVMNGEPGFIEIVPHPEVGMYQFANCLPGYPTEPAQIMSKIYINGEVGMIATLLSDFSAALRSDGIEVAWQLAECDEGIEFFVLRAEGESNEFIELASPRIDRRDLEFAFTDEMFEGGRTYRYRVEYRIDGERRLLFVTDPVTTPELPLTLYQNAPNPFNPATTIRYYLPEATDVVLEIYDVSGRRVACPVCRRQEPGNYSFEWRGINDAGVPVSSGVYFYRLIAGREILSRKMVLLR